MQNLDQVGGVEHAASDQDSRQRFDHLGVVLAAHPLAEVIDGRQRRHRAAPVAAIDEAIEALDGVDDSCPPGNAIVHQAEGPGAVGVLVVIFDDVGDRAQELDRVQDLGAQFGVAAHKAALLVGEFVLAQNVAGDADLADIMQVARVMDHLGFWLSAVERLGGVKGEFGDADGVPLRARVLGLADRSKRAQGSRVDPTHVGVKARRIVEQGGGDQDHHRHEHRAQSAGDLMPEPIESRQQHANAGEGGVERQGRAGVGGPQGAQRQSPLEGDRDTDGGDLDGEDRGGGGGELADVGR